MSKLILFGSGGVGCALLEMIWLTKIIQVESVLIFDPRDLSGEPIVRQLIQTGVVKHIQIEVIKSNLIKLLGDNVKRKDIIVDVSYNIYFKPLIQWCLDHDVMYINTSMERWPVKNEHVLEKNIYNRTLYHFHDVLRRMKGKYSPTIVVHHGMNPGLISHFTKRGIKNVADQVLNTANDRKIINIKLKILKKAYVTDDFPMMAYLLKLETIHCSEKDTQISTVKRKPNEFMNTWGAYSFYGEGIDPVQLGYGNHEKKIMGSIHPPKNLEQNQIFLPVRGLDLQLESYVPIDDGVIRGMVIPHSENDTINRSLTLYSKGKLIHRISNYYVYSPCKDAWDSIEDVKKNDYKMLNIQHSLRGTEIKSGCDAVGALLIFKHHPVDYLLYGNEGKTASYWAGTILSIEQTRNLGIEYAGPTTIQVAISIISALEWMKKHPKMGICFPEQLPYEYVLERCNDWLGTVFMDWVTYSPRTTLLKSFIIKD